MSAKPKISVVAPMYNVSMYLKQCLDSVCNQSLSEIEIILIDDGSPDESGAIADRYAEVDSRVKVIHKQNEGVSAARNDGIAAASGDYIFLLDSDDYLSLDALEKMYGATDNGKIDLVLSDYVAFSDKNETEYQVANKGFATFDKSVIAAAQMAVFNMGPANIKCGDIHFLRGIGAAWHYLIKRSLIAENAIGFEKKLRGLFDDGCFVLNTLDCAESLSYVQVPTYHYRHVEGSITRKFGGAPFEKYSAVYRELEGFFKKKEKEDEFWRALSLRKFIYLNKSMETYFFHPQNEKDEGELYSEFLELVKSPEYHREFSKVDSGNLGCPKSLFLLWTLRLGFYRVYWWAKKSSVKGAIL